MGLFYGFYGCSLGFFNGILLVFLCFSMGLPMLFYVVFYSLLWVFYGTLWTFLSFVGWVFYGFILWFSVGFSMVFSIGILWVLLRFCSPDSWKL